MDHYDLAIAFTWEYDIEFVDLLESIFHKSSLTTYIVREFNVHETIEKLRNREIYFSALLDRASDVNSDFEPLNKILTRKKSYIINPNSKVKRATDKALMHKKLLKKNLILPETIIIPEYDKDEDLNITYDELDIIKYPFIIKPTLFSGGGMGVERNGFSLEQIHEARIKSPTEKFMIQEKIEPRSIENKRAWFRVFWAFDKVIPTWWNDQTHIYSLVTAKQIKKYHLLPLMRITRKLARLNNLDYFSTEIAINKSHRFVLIDYVNDQCDMRLQSNHLDGVPDVVVVQFINSLKKKIRSLKK